MSVRITTCSTCGEQTGVYEAGRIESVAANKCKCPLAPAPRTVTEERWGLFHTTYRDLTFGFCGQEFESEEDARAAASLSEVPVRVTLTYTVPEGR